MSKPYNFRTKTRKTNVIINVFPSKTVLPSNKHMANDPAQTHIRKESSFTFTFTFTDRTVSDVSETVRVRPF